MADKTTIQKFAGGVRVLQRPVAEQGLQRFVREDGFKAACDLLRFTYRKNITHRTFAGGLDVEALEAWIINAIEDSETQKQARQWTAYANKDMEGLRGWCWTEPTVE